MCTSHFTCLINFIANFLVFRIFTTVLGNELPTCISLLLRLPTNFKTLLLSFVYLCLHRAVFEKGFVKKQNIRNTINIKGYQKVTVSLMQMNYFYHKRFHSQDSKSHKIHVFYMITTWIWKFWSENEPLFMNANHKVGRLPLLHLTIDNKLRTQRHAQMRHDSLAQNEIKLALEHRDFIWIYNYCATISSYWWRRIHVWLNFISQ